MPNIDTLSVQFNANGTKTAVNNIKEMAAAVRNLADGLKTLDASKLQTFASSMQTLKSSTPTKSQTERMVGFANAVTELSNAIGAANITSFAKDMQVMGEGVQAIKGRSVQGLTTAVTAMQQLSQTAQTTANSVQSAAAKMPKTDSIQGSTTTAESVRTVVAELDKVASRTDTIKQKFKGLIVPTKGFKSLEEQADKVAKKYDELREKMQKALDSGEVTAGSSAYEKMAAQLDGLRNQYDQLILKQKELTLEGGGIQLNPAVLGTLNAFKTGFSQVTDIVKRGLSSALKSVNSHLKSFVGHIKSAAASAKKLVTGGNSATDMAKKFSKELLRVSKMLKLMVTRMALRKVIEEVGNGFKSLAIHSDEFNNSVSSIMNASKQLGYSFASLVSPLVNALAPAIVYIINLLIKLLNVFNQVISALTGASVWRKAKSFTDSWRDSITGAGKAAGKAAKELKKTVLGFDELNQLQDNNSSGGGGGSDIKDMFEDMQIDPKWKDFADWLKEMWKNKDFYDLGKLIGTKLRDALESIPWDKIRKTSNDLGKALATLINGFVEVERLGTVIGQTLAQGVNTVFEFFNGFVHNLHWDSIGKFIADTFNGFFETIDWALIKDTVVTGLKGIADAIQSFIDNFHWDNISNFLINAVDTISAGIKAFFENINWGDLGRKIGDQITKTIKGINWRQVGQAIGDIFKAAIDFFAGLIEKINVDDVVKAASELFQGFFEKIDTVKLGESIGKLLQFCIDFIKKFWDENKETIKEKVSGFFKGVFSELDKEDIAKIIGAVAGLAILNGLKAALAFALAEIGKQAIGKMIANALFGGAASGAGAAGAGAAGAGAAGSGTLLGSATVAGSSIAAGLVGGILAFLGGSEVGKKIGELIFPEDKDLYEKYEGVRGTLQLYKDTAVTVAEEIGYAWSDAKNNLGDKWDEIKEAARTFGERTGEHLENFKTTAREKFDSVDDKVNEFGDKLNQKKDNINTSFATLKDNAATKLGEFSSNVQEKFNNAKTHLETFATNADSKVNDIGGKFNTLKQDAATKLSEFSASVKEKFETAKANIETFKIDATAKFDEFKTKVALFKDETVAKFGELKNDWKTKLDEAESTFKEFKDNLAKAFSVDEWTFSGVAEGLKKTFDKAKEAIGNAWNSIADKLNGEHEVAGSSFKINLPKFATGGFPEDGLFMANRHELVGEFSNGKTAVANNAQIVEGIQAGVYNAVSRAMANNGGNDKYIVTEMYLDSEKVGSLVSKGQEKTNRRYSPSMA